MRLISLVDSGDLVIGDGDISSGVSNPLGVVVADAERVALGTEELATEVEEFCLEGVKELSVSATPRLYEIAFDSGKGILLRVVAVGLTDCGAGMGSSLRVGDSARPLRF